MLKRVLLVAFLGLSVTFLAAGCAQEPVRTPVAGPDWSRGALLGECSYNEPVALYPEGDGQRVHVAWGRVSDDGDYLQYLQLDATGAVARKVRLPLPVRSPHRVSLLPDGEGGLVVCYISGVAETRRLHSAHLNAEGAVVASAADISGEGPEVDDYVAVPTPSGIEVFWSNSWLRTRGLYHLRLDRTGALVMPSHLLVPGGFDAHAQYGGDGRVHLAWLEEPGFNEERVYYAAFDAHQRTLGEPALVGSFMLKPKATHYGPVLALSEDRVYIFWSWQFLAPGGLYFGSDYLAGEGELHYVSFPPEKPDLARDTTLLLRPDTRPRYRPAKGTYTYSQLAPTGPGGGQLTVEIRPPEPWLPMRLVTLYRERGEESGLGTYLVCMPSPALGQRDEVALGLVLQTSTRTRTSLQVGVAYFTDGAEKGYQLAGRGRSATVRPTLTVDGRNELHLAWLESAGFNRYRVYYASTSPEVRRAMGRLGSDDVLAAIEGAGWAVAQAASIAPASILWVFLPLVLVILYCWLRPEAHLAQRQARWALAAAILLHVLGKLGFFPGSIAQAAPLADRLPASVAGAYIAAVPGVVILCSLGVLVVYARRSERRSPLASYVVFAAADTVLTSLLYGPGILS